jgi:hypothetical protein
MTHLNNCESQKEILMQTFFFHFSRFLIMSSTDSEIQRDELDVLTSILDETAFEINEKTTTTETTHGTLVIEVTLPDEFYIAYHSSIIIIYFFFHFNIFNRSMSSYSIFTTNISSFYFTK